MADPTVSKPDGEEEEESDYEYEYETESDFEEEDESSNACKNDDKNSKHGEPESQLCTKPSEDETRRKPSLSKEQIEAMKPKLPAYITSPEPCMFSDDPCQWIAWMEQQVNKERERRMRQILAPSPEPPEVKSEQDIIEKIPNTNCEELSTESNVSPVGETPEDVLVEVTAIGPVSNLEKEESISNEGPIIETEEKDEESEWEYETEDEEAHENKGNINKEDSNTFEKSLEQNNEEDPTIDIGIENNLESKPTQIDTESSCKPCSPEDPSDGQVPTKQYKKQISCPSISASNLISDDIQRKLDFIRKKKASLGQTTGENPVSISVKNSTSVLDEETQRKLSFIRQKKLEAAQNFENVPNREDANCGGGLSRQISNPEKKMRPQSLASDSSLNDMLARIKTLREERKQILQDMSAIKSAFGSSSQFGMTEFETNGVDDGICSGKNTPNSELTNSFHNDYETVESESPPLSALLSRRSIDSGIGSKSLCSIQDGSPTAELETIAGKSALSANFRSVTNNTRKICRETGEEGQIFCFICGDNMGKLSKGSIMHMGLEDGDPVCPDALYLTEESKEKIRQIATTKTFSFEAKYDMLETLELETWDVDYDIPAGDVMDKVDAFLVDVEFQKQRDKERFDAMRTGAIDDVFKEEFAELMSNGHSSDLHNIVAPCDNQGVEVCDINVPISDNHFKFQPPPPPPLPSSTTTAPPVTQQSTALSAVLSAIKHGNRQLKHAETVDKSEIEVGKVIHRHIAPIAFTRNVRSLVKDIAKSDHKKRLKQVKTNDKSRPFIPADVEIYFYGGPNASKSAPPPPLSKIKFASSSQKRANVRMENGVSPVYLAAQEGHLDVLKYLVDAQAGDINARAHDGMAPVHAAAQMGFLSCVQWMVQDKGVEMDLKDADEATPLHFAASRGHTQVVRWLLEQGAQILPDKFGKTPLHDATDNNQSDVLVLLLRYSRALEQSSRVAQESSKSEPFFLHPPAEPRRSSKEESEDSAEHEYEAISGDEPDVERGDPPLCGAPPPPPLPPPDLLTPALNRRNQRRHSGDSINSLSTLSSKDEEDCHVLKPSELSKGKKRKNIPKDEAPGPEEERTLKPGAHMVLPFIPPKFASLKREGDSLIKPSEYLRSLSKPGSAGRLAPASEEFASEESGFESPDCSLPSSCGSNPPHPLLPSTLPVIPEAEGVGPPPPPPPHISTGPPPPPPPHMGGGPPPPPPPPPPHPALTSTLSAPPNLSSGPQKEEKMAPQSMAISMRELQSVQLKKRDRALDRTQSVPLPRALLNKSAEYGDTKGDLIAELKLSHNVGGVSKLKTEQAKVQEEVEKDQVRKFMAQFTAENFLKKIPVQDPLGNEIPKWKREMMAKKAAEKAKADAVEERAKLEEARRVAVIPAWKRQLMDKKGDDAKRVEKQLRETERRKKLICKL